MTNPAIIEYVKNSFELKNQGFYKPAIEMLYKALAIEPENSEILVQLAQLYKLLDNTKKTKYYIEKVLEINPSCIECLSILGEIYISDNDFIGAKEIAEKIYSIKPDAQNLANKLNILNNLDEYQSIVEIENTNENVDDVVLYEIATAHYRHFDLQKAIIALEKAKSYNSANYKVNFLLAKILYEQKDDDKANNIFVELLNKNETSEVLNYLGLILLNQNHLDKASNYFYKAYNQNEQNPEYAYNLASTYFLRGWVDEAIKYFNMAICHDSENINYHFSLAYAYYQKQDFDKAQKEIDFIYTLEQNNPQANTLKALILSKNGDLLTAKAQLDNLIKYNTPDDFTYYAMAQVCKDLLLTKQAIEAIQKAIELNPASLSYLAELMELEFSLNNLETTTEIAEKIIEINNKYISAFLQIAKIHNINKDYNNLFNTAQEIIELDSSCPEGYYFNAIALFNQNDKDFAIESLKKAISLDLNNPILYIQMSEFYQELGDFKQAYLWGQEASEIDSRNYKYKWLCAKLAQTLKLEKETAKHYSNAYRLFSSDEDLNNDYASYLKSIGKEKQAQKILK